MSAGTDHWQSLLEKLAAIVGPGNTFAEAEAEEYGRDQRGIVTGPVVAAVRPGSTNEVSDVVRACAEVGISVCTLGGNTGLSGGAQPVDGQASVVVSLSRMRAIEEVDVAGSTATVQAGTTIQAIQDAAASAGRMFAPDWGARGTASIGGAISTNAGGINVLQFGPTRDHILGLEVVLADGRIWNGLSALRKDSTGYQLRQFFIGAEGTLGIVTRAVVKLLPAIHDHQTALVALRSIDDVLSLLALARSTGGTVTAFELMPKAGIDRAVEKFDLLRPIETVGSWYVLVRVATPHGLDAADAITHFLEAAHTNKFIVDATIAATTDQEETLWMIRDEMPPTQLWDNLDGYIKYDTAVPVGRVVDFVKQTEAAVAQTAPGWRPFSFGHIGDGNIHLHVLPPLSGDWEPSHRLAAKAAIDAITFEFGGTLSAEHGVGQVLRDEMSTQKDSLEIELAWRIKNALDPHGLFNPGKTIPNP